MLRPSGRLLIALLAIFFLFAIGLGVSGRATPVQAAPSTDPKIIRPELRPAPGFTRGENPAKA